MGLVIGVSLLLQSYHLTGVKRRFDVLGFAIKAC